MLTLTEQNIRDLVKAGGLDPDILIDLAAPAFTIDKLEMKFVYIWFKNGARHRDNGPAIIGKEGNYLAYYKNGLLHRDSGPAVISGTLHQFWKNGELIREIETSQDGFSPADIAQILRAIKGR